MGRTAASVPFSLRQEDQARLNRLVEKFGQGSRTQFLRVAMDRMEVAERAEVLRGLQVYGTERAQAAGLVEADIPEMVRRSLNPARAKPGPSSKARALAKRALTRRSRAG
jgi:hypothetical protein